MATKPFRVTSPSPAPIGRLPDGKFTRGEILAPPQIVRRSSDSGIEVSRIVADNPAVEHARPAGTPHTTSSENPWPELGPTYNEAGRSAFRIVG